MSRKRPLLQEVQRLYPSDMARCAGYTWHLGTRIGKGSFGEVYLGWTSDGKEEVAVKAVSKSYFKQDPKVRENLEREIRIMKLLKTCDYVVRLCHVQDMKQHIVLVMELCEYDLDFLVKQSPFREDDITLFLFQLGQGMKALREQNIVHRDLKPGNILIKKDPVTGKMKIKLADFGFARHFTEEGTKKPIDMHSLAGTPVFMAPEALRCVFYPGEHYDDKVDIWSIGALLYKVIVGQCGFYAQLQDIPKILKHKKDAIAFERVGRNVNYVQELPASVNDRLSADYRVKMNRLLKHLLKLDPQERMNFHEFFEFVEDLVHSKIEVVNLLQGTSGKIIYDRGMTVDGLKKEIRAQLGVPATHQLVFSPDSPHYLSPNTAISSDNFTQLMEKCGAARGNGMLYLLPTNDVQKNEGGIDFSCLSQLRFAVSDETKCVELITDHKFSNEVVYAISLLQNQQQRQGMGLKDFSKFCSQELETFKAQGGYNSVHERGLQTLAQLSLAADWLGRDLEGLPVSGGPQESAQMMVRAMKQYKTDVSKLVMELETSYRWSEQQLTTAQQEGSRQALDPTQHSELIKDAKRLPELRRVEIFGRCQVILQRCEELLKKSVTAVRRDLQKIYSGLANVWTMAAKCKQLTQLCQQVEEVLTRQVPPLRASLLSALTKGTTARDMPLASPSTPVTTPPVVVTPPGWPRPPPGPGGHSSPYPPSPSSPYQPSPSSPYQPYSNSHIAQPSVGVVSGRSESKALAALKDERDNFESLFQAKAEECAELAKANTTLKAQLGEQRKRASSSSCDEERTLAPGTTLRPTTPTEDRSLRASLSSEDTRVLEGLRDQLKSFCLMADHLKPGLSLSERVRAQSSPTPRNLSSPALYPTLRGGPEDYAIISMTAGGSQHNSEGAVAGGLDSVEQLIPQASQLMAALRDGLRDLGQSLAVENSVSGERTLIKIAKPREYIQGDIVLFSPLRLPSKNVVPMILHTEKPYPYIIMDSSSYTSVGIRHGKVPDLLVARLLERPRAFRFEDDKEMKQEFPSVKGEFYRVRVEATAFNFLPSKGPPRPPAPRNKLSQLMHKSSNSGV